MIPPLSAHILRFVLIVATMLGASPALAQDTSLRASLSASEVYAGDQVQLSIDVVNGSDTLAAPPTPEIPGCRVTFAGRSTSTQMRSDFRSGRRVTTNETTISFRYLIMPTRVGDFVVPPVSITTDDGRTLRTAPTSFRAVQTPQSDSASLELEVDADRAFAGQPVRLRLRLVLPATNVRAVEFGQLDTGGMAEVKPPPDPRRGGNARAEFIEFTLWGEPAIGVLGSVIGADGAPRRTLTVDRLVLPTEPGTLRLGPTTAFFEEAVGTRRGQGLFMRDQTVYERRQVSAEPVSIEVQALPPAPTGSVPVVGPIELSASLSNAQLGIGDPATLTVRVTGDEPLDRVELPDLAADTDLADRFRFDAAGWTLTESSPGQRQYELSFRVASPEVTGIGPVEIGYFDPEAGTYSVASTGTLPIDLRRTRVVTADDALTSGIAASRRDPLSVIGGGPIANHAELGRRTDSTPLSVLGTAPGLVAATAPPLFAAVCLALARRQHRPDTPAARRARALRQAKRCLRRGTPPESIARAFVAEALAVPPSSVTAEDTRRLGPRAARGLAPLIEAAEASRLTGDAQPAHALPTGRDMLGLLRAIVKESDQ